jgi:lysophospholipase L1-like esterase
MASFASESTPDSTPAPTPIKIVIIGDSTVCNYPAEKPDRGWGMFIEEYFKADTVQIINLAKPGRSTKTFIQEGRWKEALKYKPNFVFIQFGHNDSHGPDKPESTDAATYYKEYLRCYIDDSRAIGATPILITPMARRIFDAEGKIVSGLARYADAMKEVAAKKNVGVIDLNTSSKVLFEQLGPEKSAELANRKGDVTHFNEKGARAMADLVMKELPVAEPALKKYLKAQ